MEDQNRESELYLLSECVNTCSQIHKAILDIAENGAKAKSGDVPDALTECGVRFEDTNEYQLVKRFNELRAEIEMLQEKDMIQSLLKDCEASIRIDKRMDIEKALRATASVENANTGKKLYRVQCWIGISVQRHTFDVIAVADSEYEAGEIVKKDIENVEGGAIKRIERIDMDLSKVIHCN